MRKAYFEIGGHFRKGTQLFILLWKYNKVLNSRLRCLVNWTDCKYDTLYNILRIYILDASVP